MTLKLNIALIISVLTLACSLAFSLGILNQKVQGVDDRLVRIEEAIDAGGVCRQCNLSSNVYGPE